MYSHCMSVDKVGPQILDGVIYKKQNKKSHPPPLSFSLIHK